VKLSPTELTDPASRGIPVVPRHGILGRSSNAYVCKQSPVPIEQSPVLIVEANDCLLRAGVHAVDDEGI
jgi:hypothetical protein